MATWNWVNFRYLVGNEKSSDFDIRQELISGKRSENETADFRWWFGKTSGILDRPCTTTLPICQSDQVNEVQRRKRPQESNELWMTLCWQLITTAMSLRKYSSTKYSIHYRHHLSWTPLVQRRPLIASGTYTNWSVRDSRSKGFKGKPNLWFLICHRCVVSFVYQVFSVRFWARGPVT